MPVLLTTYTLKNRLKNYTPLFEAIKANSNRWWHYIDDTWLIDTYQSADQFARKLFPHIETTDRLLVVRITDEHQGWLPKDAWDWINARNYP